MSDVAFYEIFAEEEECLRALQPPGLSFHFNPGPASDTSPPPESPIVCIRTQSRIPSGWIPRIRAVLTRSTGFDHLLPLARLHPDVHFAALPEYCTRAVAEQSALLWMSLLRRLPSQLQQSLHFRRDGLTGRECQGRTIAIFGAGRIGGEIAALARQLNMHPLAVDPVQRHNGLTYVAPEVALAQSDVVVCSMDLNATNQAYFDDDRFARFKPDAVFVNVARGELSPPAPLLRALESHRIAGAALDVFDRENDLAARLRAGGTDALEPTWRALFAHPCFIATPHNAFNTQESLERKCRLTVDQVLHWIRTGTFRWPLVDAAK